MTVCKPDIPLHPVLLLLSLRGVYIDEAKDISLHAWVRDVMEDIQCVLYCCGDRRSITSQAKLCAVRAARDLALSLCFLPKADIEFTVSVAALHNGVKRAICGQRFSTLHARE